MNDGRYRLRFHAAGSDSDGSLTVAKDVWIGDDAYRHLAGTFVCSGNNLEALIDVISHDGAPLPIGDVAQYTIKLAGSASSDRFNVIGVGPLGLIVELTGEWESAPGSSAPP